MDVRNVTESEYIIIRRVNKTLIASTSPATHKTMAEAIEEANRLAKKFGDEFLIFEANKVVKQLPKYIPSGFVEAMLLLKEGKKVSIRTNFSEWTNVILNKDGHAYYESTGMKLPCSMDIVSAQWRYISE